MGRGFILVAFLLINTWSCYAQTTNLKPLPPTFQWLTLNPGTGVPTMNWIPPNYSPVFPSPTGFIIYQRVVDELGNIKNEAIDTVPPTQYTYTHMEGAGLAGQIIYTVASNGPTEPSQLTAHHGSVFLTATYDSCSNEIDLQWAHYMGWGNRIEDYTIYFGFEREWQNLDSVGFTKGNQNTYSIPVDKNRRYFMYLRARKSESDYTSLSNVVTVNTRVARSPDYVSIDSVLAGDNQTDIYFSIDPETEFRNFALYRWSVPVENSTAIFNQKVLYEFTDPNESFFTDTSDAWDVRSKPFYYRVNTYDGCGRIDSISNVVNSVPLKIVTRGLINSLTWNKLHYSVLKPVMYRVYRIVYGDAPYPAELIFESTSITDTTFVDDVSVLEGQGLTTLFCYYVDAMELNDEGGIKVLSRTRLVCTNVTPEIVMPNAIDPLSGQTGPSGGNPRNLFAPTISFKSSYTLTVFSRWGGIVFLGIDQGWNGYTSTGELAKEGSYIYRLEVHAENSRTIVKTGSLTVMYGPKN